MSKTDKELTTEIVVAFLHAWSGEGKTPTKFSDMPNLIQTIFDAIHNLPDETDK